MNSIRSVLIKTSMTNVQKEIYQLENWLLSLPSENNKEPNSDLSNNTCCNNCSNIKYDTTLNKISEQMYNQQLILNNILERLDVIEGFNNSHREIFIDRNQESPWIDNQCESLEDSELYTVYKNISVEELVTPVKEEVKELVELVEEQIKSVEELVEEVVTPVEELVEELVTPLKEEVKELVEEVVTPLKEVVTPLKEVVTPLKEVVTPVEEVVTPLKELVTPVEELVTPVEEVVTPVKVLAEELVEEVEESELVEEVESEQELEEIVYKHITYYKDSENFIYSIINEELSENPIGIWKEKTKMIAFYKTN